MASDDEGGAVRIRDAALELFGSAGVGRVSLRAIAARAGVSPALVVHHFGSKEGLRKACDAYVSALVRGEPAAAGDSANTGDPVNPGSSESPGGIDDPAGLAAMLEATTPVRRYMARAFLDGTPEAAALFDEIVDVTEPWLEQGVRDGKIRPAEDPRARAALYVTWLLAPLAFDAHLSRVLGVTDIHDTDTTLRYARVSLGMLTHGVFTDDRALDAWDEVVKERKAP